MIMNQVFLNKLYLMIYLDYNTVIIVFSLMGKFCTSMLTVANNAFTFELFPTVSRGITIALCSTSGKLGAIIAPYIAAMVQATFKTRDVNRCKVI